MGHIKVFNIGDVDIWYVHDNIDSYAKKCVT